MLPDNLLKNLLTILLAGAAVFGIVQTVRLTNARNHTTAAALAADTLQASADTTRDIHIDVAGLGDSLRASQRRAIQVAQRADALDRSLGLERVARDSLRVTITRLQARVRGDSVFSDSTSADSTNVGGTFGGGTYGERRAALRGAERGTRAADERRAAFDLRSAPYTVHADVALPPPPDAGRMDVRVDLDTLALEIRIGCGVANATGVRPASVSAVAPKWATVRLDRVEQAPGVCAADVQQPGRSRWWALESIVARFGVSVGYVAARAANGTVTAGPGLGVGFRVWP
jgi:hypothetical protein